MSCYFCVKIAKDRDDLSAVTQNHVSVYACKYVKLHARDRVYTRKLSTPVNMLTVALLAQVVLSTRSCTTGIKGKLKITVC